MTLLNIMEERIVGNNSKVKKIRRMYSKYHPTNFSFNTAISSDIFLSITSE
jgi:hypothetical protein